MRRNVARCVGTGNLVCNYCQQVNLIALSARRLPFLVSIRGVEGGCECAGPPALTRTVTLFVYILYMWAT